MGAELEAPLMGAAAAMGTPVRGAVFVLTNTILGAGMLGLPFAFASCGFLVGPCMLLMFACTSVTALFMLAECGDCAGRPATFNSVAERAMPGSGILIDVAVAIKCFGVATSYLIVIGDSVPKSVVSFGGSGIWLERRTWTLLALVFAAPLAYMKKITALRNVALAALTCVLLITVMIFLFSLNLGEPFDQCPADGAIATSCPPGPVVPFTTPVGTLRALPLFVFSYTCHQNIFSITNELHMPTRSRNLLVCASAVGTALCVYIVLGGAGYMTFGNKVAHDILANYPATNMIVSLARLAISFVVTCCYPLQAHPTRACLTTIANRLLGGGLDANVVHYTITTVFVLTTATIAMLIDDLGIVLSIVGATGSTIVSYILPGLCYLLLFPKRATRWVGLVLLIAGVCFMSVSLYLIFFGASVGHRRALASI